jgi:hypothetical protein
VQAAVQNNQNFGWYMASFLTTAALPHAVPISPEEFFLFPKFKFTFKGYCFDSVKEIQVVVLEQLTQRSWKWYMECWGKKGHVTLLVPKGLFARDDVY